MYILQIWIIFILTVIVYVKCGDNPSNTHGTIENDSDEEDDNFDVTEPSNDVIPQPSSEVSEEEIDVEASGPEEQQYPLGPPQPTHQHFTPEPEQTEPLDLSIQPIQPQPVHPAHPHQIYPHPVQPPQPIQPQFPQQIQPQFTQQIQPGYPIRPIALYPRPPTQPIQPIQPIQPPLPLRPGHPVRPIPRYPQVSGYSPYHPYARPPLQVQRIPPPQPPSIPPTQPQVSQPQFQYYGPPTHYIPPTQPVQPIATAPTHYIPPRQPAHIPQPIQHQFQQPEHIPQPIQPQFQQPEHIPHPVQPQFQQPEHIPHPVQPQFQQPEHIPHPPTYYVPPPMQPAPAAPSQPTDSQEKVIEKKTRVKCEIINFMKKDPEGKLVPMSYFDHARYYADSYRIKYKLSANLEQILCDGELAYEHTPGTPYPSLLIENRRLMEFIVRCGDKLIKVKHHDHIWKRFEYNIPLDFELFTKDGEGNDVIIPEDTLEIDFGYYRSIKFLFIEGTKCHKIFVENKLVWEKGEDEGYPVGFAITTKSKFVIFFEKRIAVYTKLRDCYKLLYSKPRRNSKYE